MAIPSLPQNPPVTLYRFEWQEIEDGARALREALTQAQGLLCSLQQMDAELGKILDRVEIVAYREADDLEEWEKEEVEVA